jgi:hypothetical protein
MPGVGMKSTIEFNLPEEQDRFRMATDGWVAHAVLRTIMEEIRRRLKYTDLPRPARTVLEELSRFVYEEIEIRGLDIQ